MEEQNLKIKVVERFLRYCNISKGMAQNTTIKQYSNDIYDFCNILNLKTDEDIFKLKAEQVEDYLQYLTDHKYSVSSYNKKLSTLKSFYGYLELEDLIVKNVFRKYNTKKNKPKPKIYLTLNDGYKLVNAARNERDKLMLKFYLNTGVRVSEIQSIRVQDVKWATNEVFITRKGGKQQLIVVPRNIIVDIDHYIHHWRAKQLKKLNINPDDVEYLFISFRGGQMHTNCLNNTIKSCAKRAGIENWKKIHNHTMRTSYATQMHKAGVSDKAIQLQLGHNNVSTTLNSYVQVDNEQIRNETQGKGFNFGLDTMESDIQERVKEYEKSLRENARVDRYGAVVEFKKPLEIIDEYEDVDEEESED